MLCKVRLGYVSLGYGMLPKRLSTSFSCPDFFDNSEKPALYDNYYCTGAEQYLLRDPKTLFGIIRRPLTRIIILHFVTNPISL